MKDYMLDPPEYPDPPECPICHSDLYDEIFKDINGEVCGCSECIEILTDEEWWLEFEEEDFEI